MYEGAVTSAADAIRKCASMLGEVHADSMEQFLAGVPGVDLPFTAETYVSLSSGTDRCPAAIHVVQTVTLVDVREMDRQAAEGGT